MKYGDVMFGTVAAIFTYAAGHFNEILAAVVGLVSLCVMLLRLRREWKHRDDPPDDTEL